MPRHDLPVRNRVEYLSVLNADAELDRNLDPKLSGDELLKLFRTMLFSRHADQRSIQLQSQGRIGTYAPCVGQEATPLGVAFALTHDDWFVPSFRELAGMLWRGWTLSKLLCYWGGLEYGSISPEGVNDLPICVPVASQCQNAMGIAWGLKLKGEQRVCAAFIGDGGTSEGDFHEAMNFAGVYQVPLVMVVQNNQWSISLPTSRQTAAQSYAHKAVAYGCDALQVDGNDILGVIVAAREAIRRAREGGGPTLIEAVTYRLGVHTTADNPRKYRSAEEEAEWEGRDPLLRFRKYLRRKRLLSEAAERHMVEEIHHELDEQTKYYESYPVDAYEFFNHTYAEMTPELREQLAELQAYRGDDNARPPAPRLRPAAAPQRPQAVETRR